MFNAEFHNIFLGTTIKSLSLKTGWVAIVATCESDEKFTRGANGEKIDFGGGANGSGICVFDRMRFLADANQTLNKHGFEWTHGCCKQRVL